MSFHGGLIGVAAGALYTAKKNELQFLEDCLKLISSNLLKLLEKK